MRAARPVVVGGLGLALGYALSRAGYTDWDQINAVFTLGLFDTGPSFRHLRLLVMLVAGALTGGAVLWVFARHDAIPPRCVLPGNLVGALLFGVGGALMGGCPAVALVRVGEGRASAPLTVGAVVLGTWVARRVAERLRLDPGSCDG